MSGWVYQDLTGGIYYGEAFREDMLKAYEIFQLPGTKCGHDRLIKDAECNGQVSIFICEHNIYAGCSKCDKVIVKYSAIGGTIQESIDRRLKGVTT